MSTSVVDRQRDDISAEPNLDWTIEELLQWCLLQSQARTDEKRDELIKALEKQLEEGKNELWKVHERAATASAAGNEGRSSNSGSKSSAPEPESVADENKSPNQALAESATGCTEKIPVAAKKKASAVKTIHVAVIGGPYEGSTFDLKPRPRSPCFVGRSAGKKFRDRGMSLPNDSEVSTTHGKFEIKSGKAFFVDTGSTNGTLYLEQELEVNAPLELVNGMKLLIGATLVTFTFGF